jgi:Tfp pilus assembly protein PilZ
MRDRGAVRVVPKNAVTVVIENQGYPLAYGVVANISDQGACVWTNGRFEVGEKVDLRLSFAREPQPFEATGHVVWGEAAGEGQDAVRYGLQWDDAETTRLKSLIDGAT